MPHWVSPDRTLVVFIDGSGVLLLNGALDMDVDVNMDEDEGNGSTEAMELVGIAIELKLTVHRGS